MPSAEQAKTALSASLCAVIARDEKQQTIGMVRAIGDGVMKVYIQDVVVSRPYRGKGLGQRLMRTILANLGSTCPTDCMIGLFAAEGRTDFYAELGFITRPSAGFGPGMHGTLSTLAKRGNAA
jgi:predicted GNAT family N-acyltransferase